MATLKLRAWATRLAIFLVLSYLLTIALATMFPNIMTSSVLLGLVSLGAVHHNGVQAADVDLSWHAPSQTQINNLTSALDGTGVYGFIFNSSTAPDDEYGTYNWCNMPHARKSEYVVPDASFELVYVEVIHRHHKRTPYASNAFPVEPYQWNCDDQGLYSFGRSFVSGADLANAETYWQGYTSPLNPFVPSGWTGSCQFPQITAAGLADSWTHGADLYGVYHELLGFLPSRTDGDWCSKVTFRVTNNQITSQVAGMLIAGMRNTSSSVPLVVEAAGVDSLEPQYTCGAGSALFSATTSPSSSPAWAAHLVAAADLYAALDDVAGIPANDTETGFHDSFDHYFDNLSARQCHAKPLPCKLVDGANSTTMCITQDLADAVYRMGQWEYSHMYRDAATSLTSSVGNYGVWIAELSAHLRAAVSGEGSTIYYHNIAHDGSVSRVLSILQIDSMVWPGMGSEVVFEVWKKATGVSGGNGNGTADSTSTSGHYTRVLFGGQPLKSSNPSLGLIDFIPIETLLAYFDGLVGKNASLITGKCNGTIPL